MNINDYIQEPVLREEDLPELKSYREYPINLADKRSEEELINCLDLGFAGLSFYDRADGHNAPYHKQLKGTESTIRVRSGILKKLERINEKLAVINLELYLLDGYRSIECQQGIYDWMREETIKQFPKANEEEIESHLKNFISDPSTFDPENPKTWISHITGAAIDLTLRVRSTGEQLYMGGIFDDPSIVSFTGYYELPIKSSSQKHPEHDSASHNEARKNRRLLHWLMIEEGFSNLPTEWWHFDFGNQLWSKNRTFVEPNFEEVAFYGVAQG